MNKTQQFIGKQLDIIPKTSNGTFVRKIIRRGPLTRHPESSFSSGRKYYIFFLFNDILLWVQTNRVIQNVVNLKTCTITACKGYSTDRKMFILGCETYKENVTKKKKLILEARNVEEREGWFAALTNAIKTIKNPEPASKANSKTAAKSKATSTRLKPARSQTSPKTNAQDAKSNAKKRPARSQPQPKKVRPKPLPKKVVQAAERELLREPQPVEQPVEAAQAPGDEAKLDEDQNEDEGLLEQAFAGAQQTPAAEQETP